MARRTGKGYWTGTRSGPQFLSSLCTRTALFRHHSYPFTRTHSHTLAHTRTHSHTLALLLSPSLSLLSLSLSLFLLPPFSAPCLPTTPLLSATVLLSLFSAGHIPVCPSSSRHYKFTLTVGSRALVLERGKDPSIAHRPLNHHQGDPPSPFPHTVGSLLSLGYRVSLSVGSGPFGPFHLLSVRPFLPGPSDPALWKSSLARKHLLSPAVCFLLDSILTTGWLGLWILGIKHNTFSALVSVVACNC